MVSRKKLTLFGVIVTAVLVISVSYIYLHSSTTHSTFLTKKQAEEVSGLQYNLTSYTTVEGTPQIFGAVKTLSVEYSHGDRQGQNLAIDFETFSDTVYVFNNTAQARSTYTNLSQTFQFGNALKASQVANSTYKNFVYSYLISAEPVVIPGGTPSILYYWATCGLGGDYVFLVSGYSTAKAPLENMSITANWQITAMVSPSQFPF